jgi:hypothetical protein
MGLTVAIFARFFARYLHEYIHFFTSFCTDLLLVEFAEMQTGQRKSLFVSGLQTGFGGGDRSGTHFNTSLVVILLRIVIINMFVILSRPPQKSPGQIARAL